MRANKNLGRGLNALLGEDDSAADASNDKVKEVSLSDLEPGPFQPRRLFDEKTLNDLVESVSTRGVLQPLIVREKMNHAGKYEIIGGERRYRASLKAGLATVPVIVKNFSDKEAAEIALIENLQRQDLNPLEEAEGYRRLMEDFHNTQEDLAHAVGKSRSHIANSIRLLGLSDKIKEQVETGKLTAGHARALLTAEDPEKLADEIIAKGLNVRQAEKLAQKKKTPKTPKKREKTASNAEADDLAKELSRSLGMDVSLEQFSRGGRLTVTYGSLEQLDKLMRLLTADENAVSAPKQEDGDDGKIVFDEGFDSFETSDAQIEEI